MFQRILSGAALAAAIFVGAVPALAEPPVTTYELDNGLEVVVIEDHRAPVVTHMVWYRVGSADEKAGKSGIAHFLEHLMFKGTDEIPDGAFSKLVAAQGGEDNAFTSYDYTGYFQRIAADRLPIVMKMEADRMRDLRITEDQVRTERDVIIEERNTRTDNSPDALFNEQMDAAQYLNSHYGIPVIGWRQEMEGLTRQDALDWYQRYYAPDNADPRRRGRCRARACPRAGPAVLRPAAAVGQPARRPPAGAAPACGAPPRDDRPARRPGLSSCAPTWCPPTIPRTPEQSAAIDMLAAILGNGVASRLSQSLEIGQGIAVDTGAWYSPQARDDTTLTVYGAPAQGRSLDEVETAIDAELAKIVETGPTEDELARAKRVARSAYIFAQDSQSSLARQYGSALAMGFGVDDVQNWPEVLDSVTVDDVRQAAAQYLIPETSVTGRLMRSKPADGERS